MTPIGRIADAPASDHLAAHDGHGGSSPPSLDHVKSATHVLQTIAEISAESLESVLVVRGAGQLANAGAAVDTAQAGATAVSRAHHHAGRFKKAAKLMVPAIIGLATYDIVAARVEEQHFGRHTQATIVENAAMLGASYLGGRAGFHAGNHLGGAKVGFGVGVASALASGFGAELLVKKHFE